MVDAPARKYQEGGKQKGIPSASSAMHILKRKGELPVKKFLSIALSVALMITALCSIGLLASAEEDAYGTKEDGMNAGRGQIQNNYEPLEEPKNLDFSEGLRYWTNIDAGVKADYASTSVSLHNENGFDYIKMNGKNPVNLGIVCYPFYLGDTIKNGDRVALLFDWRGEKLDARIHLRQARVADTWVTSNDATDLITAETADGWNTAVSPAQGVCTVKQDDKAACYVVYIQETNEEVENASTVEIKNIRVVKTNEDSSKFWDLKTGEEITVASSDPYGTFDEGIDAGRNVLNSTYEKIEGPHNLDFSEGLRYWSWLAPAGVTVTKTTDIGSIHKADGYNYIKLNKANAQYAGFASYPFTLNNLAKEGDYLAIIYEWRGESSDFMVHMREERKGGQGDWVTDSYNTLYNAATTDDGWNTSVISAMKGLAAGEAEPYYYIGIQTNTPLNDCDTEFRNLRLVRTNGLGEDSTKFWDLKTGEEIVLKMDGEEPENPDNPENPSNPSTSSDPSTPSNPSTPDTPDAPDTPETGVALAVWPFVATIAAAGGAGLLRKKKS